MKFNHLNKMSYTLSSNQDNFPIVPQVAAVVVWSGKEELDSVALREWGRERMPHYMVPSEVIQVKDSLPRNNMGKVNKKQLLREYFKDSSNTS